MISFALIPSTNGLNLIYMICSLWAISLLMWAVATRTVGESCWPCAVGPPPAWISACPQWTAAAGVAGIGSWPSSVCSVPPA